MVSYRLISPNDLRRLWPTVKPGIDQCAHHAFGDWISEDVYTAVQNNAATLYLWMVDGNYAGVIVLSKKPQFDGVNAHIWALYVEPQYGQYIDENMKEIDEIARKNGCKRLTFHSPRKGWDRRVKRLGFVPTYTIFEKEVTL